MLKKFSSKESNSYALLKEEKDLYACPSYSESIQPKTTVEKTIKYHTTLSRTTFQPKTKVQLCLIKNK